MTVRADGIALGDLLQDALRAGPTDHPGYGGSLRLRLSMVEVHRARRKPPSAIGAGHVAKLVEHSSLAAPHRALPSELVRGTADRRGTCRVSPLGTDPMAVGADDVALCRLFEECRRWAQHRATRRESKALDRPFSMVKVHLVWSEVRTAVSTRALPQLAQELEGPVLPGADTIDLEGAVPLVVGDIRWPLIRTLHDSCRIEHMIGSQRSGRTREPSALHTRCSPSDDHPSAQSDDDRAARGHYGGSIGRRTRLREGPKRRRHDRTIARRAGAG